MAIKFKILNLDFRASTGAEFQGGTGVLQAQINTINTFMSSNRLLDWKIEGEVIVGVFNDALSSTTELRGFKADTAANIETFLQSLNALTQVVRWVLVEEGDFVLFEFTPNV